MKAAVLFLVIATALSSTSAMALNVRQHSELRAAFAEPVERKAGGCTQCACCEYITIAGIRIPVSGTGFVRPRHPVH